ncbi:MAG: DNA-directed RNA polymerase subunit beta' [Clostridiales bacterium]|uniref:DNA-directed RNA polymerase subunit beta' n=1 Tax=Lentihominibacter sp. TaxID=2944216 RepID=UPI002A91C56B|nr:DNA-directed RNA polymerase subunit beta' [Lentihominibacter sp.]MCI5852670.1 DNA-directed RNA polymerase subunit beta' [Clostridiales bacterium]MDY5286906.1 DNA-directed RNA polymerase subunit beta' [Lentihominibacter sp.]
MNDNNNYELNNFESLQIGLASTEKILSWSHGEVTKPETINYRTLKPEKDGLYCERIFGPTKDWECHCGKYKRIRYKGIVCDKCGVEVTKAKVRRERMGHIKLASPVSHIWYFKGIPSRMGLVLDISPRTLEKVLYFANFIVTDPGNTEFAYKEILTENQYREAKDNPANKFKAGMGAEAIKELLTQIDLEELSQDLKSKLTTATGQKKIRIVRRLEVVEALRTSGNRPEWMILDVIPVIPPDLRPMVQLDGGRFATSDLNDLYRRVINRNNRLNRLLELSAPDIIVRNEKRMLQEAVDALIDNGRRGRPVTGPGSRPLKSLSDMLKGKQGRFRQNLLGKRVDYSGRSVIVVGPELRFYQCGLPKKMALELFKPFIMKKLVENGNAHNIKSAKRMVEKVRPEVWDVLEGVIKDHPVMLNRAPTLHRLGIQAFEPVLVEGKAIKLHPLACTAFNADFDGDQMAVHVPLSVEAQAEARFLMLSVNNILAPKDGSPITTPTQDMILGSYYLTHPGQEEGRRNSDAEKGDGKVFTDMSEMLMAYQTHMVGLHARVKVRMYAGEDDERGKLVESTVGRFIFNQKIPQDLGYVEDRENDPYSLEIDFLCDKKKLGQIIDRCYRVHGNTETAIMLDYIKDMGYHYSTIAAITISISDMEIPEAKAAIIDESEQLVEKYEKAYRRGLVSDKERYEKVIEIWNKTTDDVADALMDSLDSLNNLFIMAHSGARGSKNQIRQIGGMRGLMANATGKTIEIPIKANFREGLSVLEYFISTNGARKGLADTALRTADSGYLTRRLVDVSHNVIVREDDCGTNEGIEVKAFTDGKEVIEKLKDRIVGRTALTDITDPQTGEILVEQDCEISEDVAHRIEEAGIESVAIRSVMTCHSKTGVCAKCYGRNLATGEGVNIGEAVGITAAQSIGEPGTQLTMRTFHTGGVAGSDITHGLPRVEELFEARKPKGLAVICEADGTVVSIEPTMDNKTKVKVRGEEERVYEIPYGARICVSEGEYVLAGDNITRGPLDPKDILRLNGVEGVYQYLLKEVQRVYKQQGVDINDKHVEVIVSQMLSKLKVNDPGDTELLPGGQYSKVEIEEANEAAVAAGGRPAEAEHILLGITKASLATNSFLSAASFQETTRVLTDAAIKGKNDTLQGLKENVIIGKLIPAGTGMKKYRSIELDYGVNTALIEAYKEMQREMDMEAELEEDLDDIVPAMGTGDDLAAAEEYAADTDASDIVELE